MNAIARKKMRQRAIELADRAEREVSANEPTVAEAFRDVCDAIRLLCEVTQDDEDTTTRALQSVAGYEP